MHNKKPALIACAAAISLLAGAASAQTYHGQAGWTDPNAGAAPGWSGPVGGLVGGALGLATLPLAPFEGRSASTGGSLDYARSAYPPPAKAADSDDIFVAAERMQGAYPMR